MKHKSKTSAPTAQPVKNHVFFTPDPETAKRREAVKQLLNILFSDADHYNMCYSVSVPTGMGKTYTSMEYAAANETALHIFCNERLTGAEVIKMLRGKHTLFIFDDTHKLSYDALHAIADNVRIGDVGVVLLATPAFDERMKLAASYGVPVYKALFEMIGQRTVSMP